MKYCWHCGRENQDEARYCRHCGAQSAAAVVEANAPTALAAAPQPQTSGMAIASLVLGLAWLYWIGSILAIVFGHLAKNEIKRNPVQLQGRGMAIAGIVLGWVGIGMLVVTIFFVWFYLQEGSRPEPSQTNTTSALLLRL